MGKGTYGNKVGRPPAKKMNNKKGKKSKLAGLKVGSPAYMKALREMKKK